MKTVMKLIPGLALLVITAQSQAVPLLQGGCAVTDLTSSTQCVGVYDPGNDKGVNSIFTDTTFQGTFPGAWSLLTKLEDPTWNVANSLGFVIAGQGTASGTWQVNSDAWDGYIQGEIMAILKAGTNAAAYEIDLSATRGAWDVTSNAWNSRALSHFSFWTKRSTVPEPSVIALLSLGILGLGLSARRVK